MPLNNKFLGLSGNTKREKSNVFLMAEDNPHDVTIFSEMLNQAFDGEYAIVCVDSFEKITEALSQGTFNALILDMNLPDRSGVENVHDIGQQYPSLPIVVLTGNEDLDTAIDSLQQGAQDYLSKNKVTPEALARSLNYAKERKNIEQRLKLALEDAAYKNVQLEAQAKHDVLTGLANRAYFQEAASRVLFSAQRKGKHAALLYFDLNNFKKINDTYGHVIGDELLKQVASRLQDVVRNSEFLARIGGDEFVVITDVLESKQEVYPLTKRIQGQFELKFDIGVHEIPSGASIGIAFYPEADNLDLLIKHADCAMYEAKNNPESSICFYSEQIAEQYARSQKIESNLGKAIERKHITSVFQPIISAEEPSTINLEALARWHSRELGYVNPDEFIAIAENTPAINGITRAITNASNNLYRNLQQSDFLVNKISINVSASQICGDHFCGLMIKWLDDIGLPAEKVCLELTERQFVENVAICKHHFALLQERGIQIALDDFGAGFSSIKHLLDLPFDILKLDRTLVNRIDQNARNAALVSGIIKMAHGLDMQVVAEGIEREEEKEKAIELGCDYLQGFYISRPLPLNETLQFYEMRE